MVYAVAKGYVAPLDRIAAPWPRGEMGAAVASEDATVRQVAWLSLRKRAAFHAVALAIDDRCVKCGLGRCARRSLVVVGRELASRLGRLCTLLVAMFA